MVEERLLNICLLSLDSERGDSMYLSYLEVRD
jgi:hypothetical protein